MDPTLVTPPSSRVSASELSEEVEEYFVSGARVAKGQTVVDVGANIGAFALKVAERCDGDVRLLCFEPAPDTFRALSSNFEKNGALEKTRHALFPIGLTSPDHAGQSLKFYDFSRVGTNSTFDVDGKRREFEIFFEDRARRLTARLGFLAVFGRIAQWFFETRLWHAFIWWLLRIVMGMKQVDVKVETLGSVLKREKVTRVDLLKVDVEGAEVDVLLGLDDETWPLVQQVVMETHNRDGRQAKMETLLRDRGLVDIAVKAQVTVDNGLDSVILVANRPAAAAA